MNEVRRRQAKSYEQAMQLCPEARSLEFRYPLELAEPKSGDLIVDFPSGGSYLIPHLAQICPGATCVPVEHISDYREEKSAILGGSWNRLPFEDGSVNIIVTLAAIHHVLAGKPAFYRECLRILGDGGRLIVADVEAGTPPARFLSEFVSRQSSEGHEAIFLSQEDDAPLLEAAGFEVTHYDVKRYHWSFPDKDTAIGFCRGLFRLDLPDDSEIWQALESYLGLDVTPDGVHMNWCLALVRADKRAS